MWKQTAFGQPSIGLHDEEFTKLVSNIWGKVSWWVMVGKFPQAGNFPLCGHISLEYGAAIRFFSDSEANSNTNTKRPSCNQRSISRSCL